MGESHPQFPPGFVFGTSTASYQIEGAVHEDGRGVSVWDTFCAQPGTIVDGSSGEVACDHYHRYAEDVALMKDLGVGAYRFSIAWPRVQPDGSGPVNTKGLDFYDRLVDELVAAGIEPMATLFHWDLPQALQDSGAGGWLERSTAERFAEYAALCAERLGDRVAKWAPVNEPNVVTMIGHAEGRHAPGLKLGVGALPVAHHLNLGHGLAVQALRAAGATQVGTANNHAPIWPDTDSAEDEEAADLFDDLWNRLFAGPMLLGEYPERWVDALPVQDGDLETIRQPIDFYGFNHYNPMGIGAAPEGSEIPFRMTEITGYPLTEFHWSVVPAGMRQVINQLCERYPDIPPIYVTENGCSYGMGPDDDGVVDDQPRIDFYDGYLRAVADAIGDGCDVRGYYAWSLMDNFEWGEGYTMRFGLVHVDYETLVRTPKRSFQWYADMIAAQPQAG
ncbi:MAG: beta-glucosidase [Marmoricola sp.]|nr:beta-glucosidase [Marmoricola sp.]